MPSTRGPRLLPCVLPLVLSAGCAFVQSFGVFGSADAPPPAPAAKRAPAPARTGALLISGGGRTTGTAIAEAVRLAGGGDAKVVVVPLASTQVDAGRGAAETWTKAGFTDVEVLDTADPSRAAEQIRRATFVWMTGGDQARLVTELAKRGLVEEIRRRHEAGALVGGTSAGAAVLSELMLAGEGDEDEMLQGRVETVGGLALWPGVIVDQHFVARRRFNRLTAAVLDHPRFVGIGVDESTAIVVSGTSLRVVGEGNVVVLDARRAKVAASRPGDASAATGVEMQVLGPGMTFDLAAR